MRRRQFTHLVHDLIIVAISVAVAIICVRVGAISALIDALDGYGYLGIFVAGMFFTSVFTTPFAIAVLALFALEYSPIMVALIGGVGALCGDFILFYFIKDRVAQDVSYILSVAKIKRLPAVMRTRLFRGFVSFLGALVIASPFPDELGIAMLGLSKVNNRAFAVVSFVFNTAGIAVIGYLAQYVIR